MKEQYIYSEILKMRNNDEIITIIKSAMKEQDMSLSELVVSWSC